MFLPECFDYVGDSKEQSLDFAESIDGPTIVAYQEIAVKENVWLSLGGFHEKVIWGIVVLEGAMLSVKFLPFF